MAKVLIVHGVANQYGGEMQLRQAWYPALCDGLNRARYSPLPAEEDCFCPYYGDLFRPTGKLGFGRDLDWDDLGDLSEDDELLIEAIWKAAVRADPGVPRPEDFGETLFRAPRMAERAVNALAKSKFLAGIIPLRFIGDLGQVVDYFHKPEIRAEVRGRVLAHITADTRLVIGHSLGSVVAYEALCAKPEQVVAFVTLGSPLGIRNVVFEKLDPAPDAGGVGRWPGRAKYWTNIAATGDIVAAEKALAPLFPGGVEDRIIDSGSDAHSSTRYLDTAEAGAAMARALSA